MDKKNLAIDLGALAVYLVAANPSLTGIGVHEWLGLGVFLVLAVHVALQVNWVVETLRTALRNPSWARAGNLALDAAIVVTLAVVTVSGLCISGAVLPTFGLYAPGYYFWDPLHAASAKVLMALLLVHVVAHWKWLARMFGKGKGGRNDGERG